MLQQLKRHISARSYTTVHQQLSVSKGTATLDYTKDKDNARQCTKVCPRRTIFS